MTNVIELAKQAGIDSMPPDMNYRSPYYACTPDELEVFAGLVRNAALEEAAKECEDADIVDGNGYYMQGGDAVATQRNIAAAIRSMKETL